MDAEVEEILAGLKGLEGEMRAGLMRPDYYKKLRWQILKRLRDTGATVRLKEVGGQMRETVDSMGAVFCYVEDGPFLFGRQDAFSELKAAIYLAQYAVTVREFEAFLDQSRWDYPADDRELMHDLAPTPDCAVTHVSWEDAKAYCRWLRHETQEYYSLPHEIEWERAARGLDGRTYPWGNEPPTEHWACFQGETEPTGTVEVSSYADNVSPHGCVGMAGNVWEWCLDPSATNPDAHVLRGGAWCSPAEHANGITRTYGEPPNERFGFAGFRVTYLPGEMYDEYCHQYAPGKARRRVTMTITGLPPPPGGNTTSMPIPPTQQPPGRSTKWRPKDVFSG